MNTFNRRRFIELLTGAVVTGGVAYSFPSIIVPRNIALPVSAFLPLPGAGDVMARVYYLNQFLLGDVARPLINNGLSIERCIKLS